MPPDSSLDGQVHRHHVAHAAERGYRTDDDDDTKSLMSIATFVLVPSQMVWVDKINTDQHQRPSKHRIENVIDSDDDRQ